jgi:peptidoglycan/xylan/chitin deacetylase (PgdA/CDA1 family)
MKISLTFDNGPDPEVTPQVLDALAKNGVKATFFLLGKNLAAPERRKLAVRAFEEGHRLGNHSYSHSVPFGLLETPADAVNEIMATDALLGELRGPERLFRPFGRARIGNHLLNAKAWDALAANKYTCVLWSCIPPERDCPDSWMEQAIKSCETQAWSVVVLHDLPTGAMRQLDRFLQMLAERGTEFSQDFPAECTPMRRGVAVGPHDYLMPAAEPNFQSGGEPVDAR